MYCYVVLYCGLCCVWLLSYVLMLYCGVVLWCCVVLFFYSWIIIGRGGPILVAFVGNSCLRIYIPSSQLTPICLIFFFKLSRLHYQRNYVRTNQKNVGYSRTLTPTNRNDSTVCCAVVAWCCIVVFIVLLRGVVLKCCVLLFCYVVLLLCVVILWCCVVLCQT